MDLEIHEGEFFCLLGPSGCGKTTTLNLIGGFVEATGGEILIQGRRTDRVPPHKRNVNTVFQNYALFPHLSVRDNVGFGLRMARVSRREAGPRIDAALTLVGLTELAERLPVELSGGQQQRVAVARALVNQPAVLLLDEPLGALDLKLRKRLQIELSQIHRDVGTTFVYVTHDQEEAMSMSTRIAVMSEGRLEQVGSPEEIYRRPATRFVADFIGESNFLEVTGAAAGVARLRDGSAVPCTVNGWAGGDGATLMVRPECVRVIAGNGHPAGLPPRPHRADLVPRQLQTRIAVSCALVETLVTASTFGRERITAPDLARDREVALWWSPDDAVLLSDSPTKGEE